MAEEKNTEERIEMRYVAKTDGMTGGTNHNNGFQREYSALVDAFYNYMSARKRNTGTTDGRLEIEIEKS